MAMTHSFHEGLAVARGRHIELLRCADDVRRVPISSRRTARTPTSAVIETWTWAKPALQPGPKP